MTAPTREQRAKQGAQYAHAQGALSRYADRVYVIEQRRVRAIDPRLFLHHATSAPSGRTYHWTTDIVDAKRLTTAAATRVMDFVNRDHGRDLVFATEVHRPSDVDAAVEYDAREVVEPQPDLPAGTRVEASDDGWHLNG